MQSARASMAQGETISQQPLAKLAMFNTFCPGSVTFSRNWRKRIPGHWRKQKSSTELPLREVFQAQVAKN
jgi:hypothetical protein